MQVDIIFAFMVFNALIIVLKRDNVTKEQEPRCLTQFPTARLTRPVIQVREFR